MSTTPDSPAEQHTEDSGGHGNLTYFIIGAIVAAIAVALLLPAVLEKETALAIFHTVETGGEVFLRALMMMVVPLVVASVMSGILGLGDVRKLGKPGFTAVAYYLSTTVLAVVVGLVWVNLIQPGKNSEAKPPESDEVVVTTENKAELLEQLEQQTGLEKEKLAKLFPALEEGLPGKGPDIGTIMKGLVLMLFTDNLLHSAANTDLLPLIVFAIIFAGMLTTMGDRVQSITTMIGQLNEAMMSFVMLLMNIAPIGIFCLVASKFGIAQAEGKFIDVISETAGFIVTVLAGLGTHAFVTLPLILWFFTRKNPYRVHEGHVSGAADGLLDSQQFGHPAGHHGCRQQSGGLQKVNRFRVAARGHDQHGRDRPVRSGGRDLHRQHHTRLRTDVHESDRNRGDRDAGGDWGRGDSGSRPGDNADRTQCGRLAARRNRGHPGN